MVNARGQPDTGMNFINQSRDIADNLHLDLGRAVQLCGIFGADLFEWLC